MASITLTIIRGVGYPGGAQSNPYCVVELGGRQRRSKTPAKPSYPAEWNQDLMFHNVDVSQPGKLQLFDAKRENTGADVELAAASFSLLNADSQRNWRDGVPGRIKIQLVPSGTIDVDVLIEGANLDPSVFARFSGASGSGLQGPPSVQSSVLSPPMSPQSPVSPQFGSYSPQVQRAMSPVMVPQMSPQMSPQMAPSYGVPPVPAMSSSLFPPQQSQINYQSLQPTSPMFAPPVQGGDELARLRTENEQLRRQLQGAGRGDYLAMDTELQRLRLENQVLRREVERNAYSVDERERQITERLRQEYDLALQRVRAEFEASRPAPMTDSKYEMELQQRIRENALLRRQLEAQAAQAAVHYETSIRLRRQLEALGGPRAVGMYDPVIAPCVDYTTVLPAAPLPPVTTTYISEPAPLVGRTLLDWAAPIPPTSLQSTTLGGSVRALSPARVAVGLPSSPIRYVVPTTSDADASRVSRQIASYIPAPPIAAAPAPVTAPAAAQTSAPRPATATTTSIANRPPWKN